MPQQRRRMMEDLVLAVLHKVGRDIRIATDQRLVNIFDNAATKHTSLFGAFAKHPQYRDSRVLSESLQLLDLGGSIVRDNPAQNYFRVSPLTRGAYGKTKFSSLSKDDRQVVEEIAAAITSAFDKSKSSNSGRRLRSKSSAK